VLAAVRRLHYAPHESARALRSGSSGSIALLVHDVTNPLYAEIVRGTQAGAHAAGYVMLLGDAEELGSNQAAFRRILAGRRMDGVLLQGGFAHDAPLYRMARSYLPTVNINAQRHSQTGSVTLDDEAAARVAVDHLIALGHTQIGFLGGLANSSQGRRRQRGVRSVLEDAGLALRPEWVRDAGWGRASGADAMRGLLDAASRPTAIIVANVISAIGALDVARERGVRVPEDLSIVAIHDAWIAEHTNPALTTVKLPLFDMARQAVDLLVEVMRGGKSRDIIVRDPAPQLVERTSVRSPLR
jgi:LacI family transcriptional regulator